MEGLKAIFLHCCLGQCQYLVHVSSNSETVLSSYESMFCGVLQSLGGGREVVFLKGLVKFREIRNIEDFFF